MSGLEWATNYPVCCESGRCTYMARVGVLGCQVRADMEINLCLFVQKNDDFFHLNKETKVISLASPPTQHNSFFQTVNPLNLNVVDLLHNHEPSAFLSAFLALVPFVAFSSLIVNIHEPKECLRGRGTRRKRALAPRLSHTPGVFHVRPAPGVSLHWRAPEIA